MPNEAFEINQAVRAYATDDNMYVPIIDGYATASTFSKRAIR